jgi:hypothetical protein
MSTELKTVRPKPELITVGNRQMVSTGRWNDDVMAQYVIINGRKWLEIGELARVSYGQNTPTSKARVRKCLPKLWDHLLINMGKLMVTEYGPPRNRALRVKMYDHTSELDRRILIDKLEKKRHRGELAEHHIDYALQLMRPDEQAETAA